MDEVTRDDATGSVCQRVGVAAFGAPPDLRRNLTPPFVECVRTKACMIHPTGVVDPRVELGLGVQIGA